MSRDVPFDEEVRERPCASGAWEHVAPLAEVEAARARIAREFDALALTSRTGTASARPPAP